MLSFNLAGSLTTIAADIIAIVTIWVKTYRHVRQAASVGVNAGFSSVLIQYGTLNFLLPNIVISRFLINLRKVDSPGSDNMSRFSQFSVPKFWMPSGLPEVLGNLGPIFSLNLGGQPAVVISDVKIVADLLDCRSICYSGRPRFVMAGEVLTKGMFLPLLSDNYRWRQMRRAIHDGINTDTLTSACSLQADLSASLVLRILEDPTHFKKHFTHTSGSMMLHTIYGWSSSRIETDGELVIRAAGDFVQHVMQMMMPRVRLVEIVPAILSLPEFLVGWKREGQAWFEHDSRMFVSLLEDVRSDVRADFSEECLGATLVRTEKRGLNTLEQAWTAGTALVRGADTMATAMLVFVLAMLLHLDVMHRAQQSIDAIVSRERLPVMADKERLPYLQAIVKEIHRWRPITPLGAPRVSSQVHITMMSRRRDLRSFHYRMIETHGYGHMTFGAGRRICPGRELVNQALFIQCATLLWAFSIEPVADEDGQPIMPSSTECVDKGLFVQPAPFQCRFTPRGPEVASVIRATTQQDG
ncbi:hypothetical protein NM688_g800 [Phlebia brevispora]|uniref:Uncharacterized protein n=1 Tax=Phlebia brevispora TaxID=194682 RepID=A0ACC1TDB4_9APHY|nr:hypothetical protein NM688_g800 [Phlebia brevispora]